jgi:hypothetical protein
MSIDMNIPRYRNEPDSSFAYRVCYSALGQWCLSTASNSTNTSKGTTKHNQTIVLNDLLSGYIELFPSISEKFVDNSNQLASFPIRIRRIYEETGYLLTDRDNHNHIAKYDRSIRIGDAFLFFGFSSRVLAVNGLGVYANYTNYLVDLKEYLIRDSLSCEEYFDVSFDPVIFCDRDIDLAELEYFNPTSDSVPSKSWTKNQETSYSVARKSELGPFYRVTRTSEGIQFAEESIEPQNDNFTSYEYRRLYFALKAHYGKPLQATISHLDDVYSKIHLGGHLPNREYYLLLLSSWPEHNAFDKANFIIRNELLSGVLEALIAIGIDVKGGLTNV